jgi:hypothetical protein
MSSSAGRRTAAYVRARELFKTGNYPCWLQLPGCTRVGLTVDHDPPLDTASNPDLWRGTYRPACQPCQSRQGAAIVNQRRNTTWTW